jgi:hypothetical protein
MSILKRKNNDIHHRCQAKNLKFNRAEPGFVLSPEGICFVGSSLTY